MKNKTSITKSANETQERGYLLTEQINPRTINIDILDTNSLVNLFCEEDLEPQKAIEAVKKDLVITIETITKRLKAGGKLFYIGAGTSGRLGVLDASECPPTFCTPPELVQGIIAGGTMSLVKSSEDLEDQEDLAVDDLKQRNFSHKDCIIGISAGGTTPYVLSALDYAKQLKALSIALVCVPKDQVKINCDIDIRLLTGAELLAGSTRLKAGTATKMALNIISTSVMIKLGKVYKNRMVDLSCTNNKLLDRSLRILSDVADVNRHEGIKLLKNAKGSVKIALLMALSKTDYNSAKQKLKQHNNMLRDALNN